MFSLWSFSLPIYLQNSWKWWLANKHNIPPTHPPCKPSIYTTSAHSNAQYNLHLLLVFVRIHTSTINIHTTPPPVWCLLFLPWEMLMTTTPPINNFEFIDQPPSIWTKLENCRDRWINAYTHDIRFTCRVVCVYIVIINKC